MNEMSTIPELSSNSFWSTRYSPSIVNTIKAGNSNPKQIDYNYQALRMFSNLSVQTFQGQQEQYRNSITTFTTSVQNASSSAQSLTGTNLFSQKYVSASTGTAVTGEAKAGASTAQYAVTVSQVATSQRNEGKAFSTSTYGGLAKGISTLGIQVAGGAERQVSVNVLATDNNGQALKKFANAINSSDAGVRAEVKTKDNTQYLSITSKNTGISNSFTIRDVVGTAATTLQLGNKVKDATDALYTVNGTSYQSASNKVTIDNGNVSLNLNNTTVGTVKVNVGKDDSKIVDAAQNLVTSFNNLHRTLSNSASVTKRGERVLNGVENLVGKTRAADFASIGIAVDKTTGDLTFDASKLSDALVSSPTKVKSLLSGAASLGKAVEKASREMANAPVNTYLKPPSIMDNLNYSSPYTSNGWMSQQNNLTQGLFLNMTV